MNSYPSWLVLLAKLLSVIMHPLLMLTYSLIFLIWANPYEFGGGTVDMHMIQIIQVFFLTFGLPTASLLLMRAMGLIPDLQLENSKDRIIPYVSTGVFYLWLAVNAYYTPAFPHTFTIICIGATAALFIAFIANIGSKVSLHAVGMGGLVAIAFIVMVSFSYEDISPLFLMVLILAGAVGTARLLLGAHQLNEVIAGYAIGILGQVAALMILS